MPSAGIDRARARATEPCQREAGDGIMPGRAQRRSCASDHCAHVTQQIEEESGFREESQIRV